MQIIPHFILNSFVCFPPQNLDSSMPNGNALGVLVQLRLLRMQTHFDLQPKKEKSFCGAAQS